MQWEKSLEIHFHDTHSVWVRMFHDQKVNMSAMEEKRSNALQRSRTILSEYEQMTQPMQLCDILASMSDAGGDSDLERQITCKADLLRQFADKQIEALATAWRLGSKKRPLDESASSSSSSPASKRSKPGTGSEDKTFCIGAPVGLLTLKDVVHDRYQEALVAGEFVVHEDDVVQVWLDTTTSRFPPTARVDALFVDAKTNEPSALLTWFYASDEVPLSDGEKKKAGLREGEYSLSNHDKQTIKLSTVERVVPEEKLDLVLFYDCDAQKLRYLETATDWPAKYAWVSQRLLVRSDMELFRDCLGHAKAVRDKSAFWQRMEDTLLRPSKQFGRDSNPQRDVLHKLDYAKIQTAKLEHPMRTKCFCCNMMRHCTAKLTAPDGDAKDAVRAIGSYCEARISRVARFLQLIETAYEVYQATSGQVTDADLKPVLFSILDLFRAQHADEPRDLLVAM